MLTAALWPLRDASADQTFEYSPYKIRVWLAVRPEPELNSGVQQAILNAVLTQTPQYAGATWNVAAEIAPDSIRSTLATSLDDLDVPRIGQVAKDVFASDKIMLLAVSMEGGDAVVACRELDCRCRTLGPVVRQRVGQFDRLPRDAAAVVVRAFSPLVRVEESRGRSARVRARAGGLVFHDYCPSLVKVGDVLHPVIRRNDRTGEPKPGGIQVVDWTFLSVDREQDLVESAESDAAKETPRAAEELDNAGPNKEKPAEEPAGEQAAGGQPGMFRFVLNCEVLSAMRNPLAGRSTTSVERLALGVRPLGETTTVRLVTIGAPDRPLEGYEIFAKKPLPKESAATNRAVRLGLTDWQGAIEVPKDDLPLRLVYIKNGSHLIARLPVVPGYRPELTIELVSDDKRLEAEAFVRGMESTVMDLVARREIVGARIRRRLEQGKTDEARQLLGELKTFLTKDDLEVMLTGRQQGGLSSIDEREQRRIDFMLSGTRMLLSKYLSPDHLVTMERLVEQGPVAPPPKKDEPQAE
ncbi:MAG: hypothetical protein FJ276_12465 [Planctomycetes bacterium]|nr:hypothetical protein [Planctomycetota bacterium]